ncbi:MAG TPA: glycoside hydrolase family 15 protein [Gammaproteobacteria bacterium]|nr:glycoside hydrolase family 15 protein [Gammaproteobacteria bacterium]
MRPSRNLDLAVIGNCEVAALIDADATIVYCCLPRLDGDPVFSALIDGDPSPDERGVFAIDLLDCVEKKQRYVRNTAILETVLADAQRNRARIVDFCPRFRARGRTFRPMTIVRLVEPLGGRPVVRVRLRPRASDGAQTPRVTRGSHNIAYQCGTVSFRVTTNASLSAIADESSFVVDSPVAFILGIDQTVEEPPQTLAVSLLEDTREYWQDWVRGLWIPYDWQDAVIRAAISLKLCSYEDTGAVLAALTTSIPESPDSGRNWDYRYCWLRDAYFTIQALNRLGATRTMEGYLRFIDRVVAARGDSEIPPLFSIAGSDDLPERVEPSLRGYRGMGPVRIGNAAHGQRQHDVYGAIVLAAAHSFFDNRLLNLGDASQFAQLEVLGEHALAVYGTADAGPWEFRGFERVHTFSAAMSWAGLDRLARIAHRLELDSRVAYWRSRAEKIRADFLERAFNPTVGAFTSSFGGDALDSTALLLPELGLLPARDPRFVSTVAAIEASLKEGDWLYRYRHVDDFGRPDTSFTVCAFWYVNALAMMGRREEARAHFERLLAQRTSLGLLSEDIDSSTGEWWGNFPQTYSLVGIINSAIRLSRPWEEDP